MLDVDVYAVGHHGSHNGTTVELLEAMTPKAAVISMGHREIEEKWTAWAYGHPRRDVVVNLARSVSGTRPSRDVMVGDGVKRFSNFDLNRAIYATGWDGNVTITADATGNLSFRTGE